VAVSGSWATVADGRGGSSGGRLSVPSAPREWVHRQPGEPRESPWSGTHAFCRGRGIGSGRDRHLVPPPRPRSGHRYTRLYAHAVALSGGLRLRRRRGCWRARNRCQRTSDPVLAGTVELPTARLASQPRRLGAGRGQRSRGSMSAVNAYHYRRQRVIHPGRRRSRPAEGAFFQTDVESHTGLDEAQIYFEWLPRGEEQLRPLGRQPSRSALARVCASRTPWHAVRARSGLRSAPSSWWRARTLSSHEPHLQHPSGGVVGTFGQGLAAIRATEMFAAPSRSASCS